MIRYSMACRACVRGWWGQPGDVCEKCKKDAIVTGQVLSVPLR